MNVVICIPVRDRMEPETEFALKHNVGFSYRLLTEVGLPVDEARNRLTERAAASNAERVIWADADAFWQPGCLERLLTWTTDPLKMIGTVCGRRLHYSAACAWQYEGAGPIRFELIRKIDGLIACHFIGAHVLASSRALLDRLVPKPWSLSETDQSEDWAFGRRLREAGCEYYLDTRAWTFHVENGIMYVPGSSAYALVAGKVEKRPLPPTAPFQRGRDYGPSVNAAKRNTGHAGDDAFRRAVVAWISKEIETKPIAATRYRIPTEDELTHLTGSPG